MKAISSYSFHTTQPRKEPSESDQLIHLFISLMSHFTLRKQTLVDRSLWSTQFRSALSNALSSPNHGEWLGSHSGIIPMDNSIRTSWILGEHCSCGWQRRQQIDHCNDYRLLFVRCGGFSQCFIRTVSVHEYTGLNILNLLRRLDSALCMDGTGSCAVQQHHSVLRCSQ